MVGIIGSNNSSYRFGPLRGFEHFASQNGESPDAGSGLRPIGV
jgi:hypothetical protein